LMVPQLHVPLVFACCSLDRFAQGCMQPGIGRRSELGTMNPEVSCMFADDIIHQAEVR
jgi:hypothetical protein